MTRLFKLAIEVYWAWVPPDRRRVCLFRESCSRYIWRQLDEDGFRAGLSALLLRWRRCRPGYSVVSTAAGTLLVLRDGSTLSEGEMAVAPRKHESPHAGV
jgi:putative component of membrane protein insertase Oxa1/YidC/SpoIIIJ protein YidD